MAVGRTNAGGGGASLNFDVKAYATEELLLAAAPKENTIGIISEHEMTGWIIDANQPENLTEGMVWISVGTSSVVEFNALKKNGLQVYPLTAKQYISGALVSVHAYSYQGGEWHDWGIILMSAGSVTNEYGTFGNSNRYTFYSTSHGRRTFSITANSGYVILQWVHYSGSANYDSSYAYFEEKIDLTDISTIIIDAGNKQVDSQQVYTLTVCSNVGDNANQYAVASVNINANKETILDVSALSGSYYILIRQYSLATEDVYIEIKDWRMFL